MKTDFYNKYDKEYLSLGFSKEGLENDPMFFYKYSLIDDEAIIDNDLKEEDVPCLLIGNTGLNKGICLSVGDTFIWFSAGTPEQAIEWAEKIISFESK